ncbi:Plasmodium variant antigen protein Cir/Yir/Bir, putative [Plasmodium chabaudi adami]|uniref:Plasmodium variant antigen protein Cir/Yir/Bir, putative n=1 Tax=Plasmodium chabaudi adami TaxID=5826 RepID=A0A1C6WCM8_PLACE|nr:Plasmodium variant antigen protein Cir/Yir/Bir, putative [Plasmodium chabaudi adami]
MSSQLCELINKFSEKITVKSDGLNAIIDFNNIQNEYCTAENGEGDCFSYEAVFSSFFIKLLIIFINADNLNTKKFGEYAILWLCNKLNQQSINGISNLDDFHNKYIKENEVNVEKITGAEDYKTYKDIINNKINLKTINIKEMSEIYGAFEKLCKLHTGCNGKNTNYTNCSKDASEFVENFENLNGNSDITGNSSYSQILFNLFNDYNDFKNDCVKKCNGCNDIPTISPIKTPQTFEHASSSSSIARKLIPVLLTFSISIFLGVAYKYSLFGFDKRFRRQYSREKLKK